MSDDALQKLRERIGGGEDHLVLAPTPDKRLKIGPIKVSVPAAKETDEAAIYESWHSTLSASIGE